MGSAPRTDYPRAREGRIFLNDRERFESVMHYRPVDRCPIRDFRFWPETLLVWKQYGLPESVPEEISTEDFFGMDRARPCGGILDLWPRFEEEVIEDRGETEVVRNHDGVLLERGKIMGAIPRHLDHLLKDRRSWEEHYKPRMRPDQPGRFGTHGGWRVWLDEWTRPERDYPISIYAGSLYGRQRDWFGLQRISEILYDDPGLFEEIVESWADLSIWLIERVCGEQGVRPESANLWEDMCYNGGPLISPATFERVMVPHYRRIVDALHRHGIDVIFVDCDGKIDKLLPLWLDAGVNCMFPVEVGTWGADPIEYRRQYGKDLLIMGGFDKHILARSRRSITEEVERLAPLVEEGGFIPFCDHLVPPDVPLSHYIHYLNEAKRVWGMEAESLRPTREPDWAGARFREEDGYTWDLKKLGLSADQLPPPV
jgi:uroporphyrinogen decarboxylase